MTPQRLVLLRVLGTPHGRHPTAEELYRRVKRTLPSISLTTVYRNLQHLAQTGVVVPVEHAGGAIRYESNHDDHHHFVCKRCRRVVDVYLSDLSYTLNSEKSPLVGAQVESCKVQLQGLCARCRRH